MPLGGPTPAARRGSNAPHGARAQSIRGTDRSTIRCVTRGSALLGNGMNARKPEGGKSHG